MKFDPKVTTAIQDWLNAPEDARDIMAGASLLLSLNRNRALYNSITRHPDKFVGKLVYELRKYLRLRLDHKTSADVLRMEAAIMPAAAQTIEHAPVLSTDDEFSAAHVARGRRPDHDSLPPEIRDLWDSNADRYRRIVLLFNELKAMSDLQPCDRYEKLVILGELDNTYRENLARYDSYVVPSGGATTDRTTSEPSRESSSTNAKALNSSRKTLSKYRKRLAELPADDPARDYVISKIKASVQAIVAAGGGIAPDTRDDLLTLGLSSSDLPEQ